MGSLWLVGSIILLVSFAEYRLFYRVWRTTSKCEAAKPPYSYGWWFGVTADDYSYGCWFGVPSMILMAEGWMAASHFHKSSNFNATHPRTLGNYPLKTDVSRLFPQMMHSYNIS